MVEPLTEDQITRVQDMIGLHPEELGGLSGTFKGTPCVYLIKTADDGDGHVNVWPVAVLIEGEFLEAFGSQMCECAGEPLVPSSFVERL